MPHFTLQYSYEGPILAAAVAVSQPRSEALAASGVPIPQPVAIRALVDTGASCTCIDEDVLRRLGLTPTGYTSVHTPSTGTTPHQTPQYDVMLALSAGKGHAPLLFNAMPVTAVDFQLQTIGALIGRDVLSHCILEYNGSMGLFTLAY